MKRFLTTLCLAAALTATLASCGNMDRDTRGVNGSAGGSVSGPAQAGHRRAAYDRGRGYDDLEHGRYSAGGDGILSNRRKDDPVRDLTQGARDLIRDAGDAIGDVGRGIGDAAREITGTPSWEPVPGAGRDSLNY